MMMIGSCPLSQLPRLKKATNDASLSQCSLSLFSQLRFRVARLHQSESEGPARKHPILNFSLPTNTRIYLRGEWNRPFTLQKSKRRKLPHALKSAPAVVTERAGKRSEGFTLSWVFAASFFSIARMHFPLCRHFRVEHRKHLLSRGSNERQLQGRENPAPCKTWRFLIGRDLFIASFIWKVCESGKGDCLETPGGSQEFTV